MYAPADPPGSWERTARAVTLLGLTLSARLWIVFGSLLMIIFLVQSGETSLEALALSAPLLLALVNLPMAWAAIRAAGLHAGDGRDGHGGRNAPGAQLTAAGMLLIGGSALSLTLLARGHREAFEVLYASSNVELLPPLLSWLAFLLLAFGLRRLARLTRVPALHARATAVVNTVAIAQTVASALQAAAFDGDVPILLSMMRALFACIAALVSLSSLAGLCRALPAGLRAHHDDLPSAIVLPR